MRKVSGKYKSSTRYGRGATNGKLKQKISEFNRKSVGYQFTSSEKQIIDNAKFCANSGKTMSKAKYMQFVRMINKM